MKIRFSPWFFSFLSLCLLTPVSGLHAQGVQTDFDGDGLSEYTIVSIQNDKSLSWKAINPLSGASVGIRSLGNSGNHIALAWWKGLAAPEPGVVSLNQAKNGILWRIINADGSIEERDLGSKNSTAISGADFNGNGVSDIASAVLKGSSVTWTIGHDFFVIPAGQGTPKVIKFGSSGDRVFFASPDGVTDWIGAFGKSGNKGLLRLRNAVTGEVRKSKRFPASLTKAPRPRPFPVKSAEGADILGFAIPKKGKTQVSFRTLNGALVSSTTLPGTGDVVVGNYNSGPGEEVAIKTGAGYTVYNPFIGTTFEAATVSGIAIDQININTVDKSTIANPGGGTGGGGGGNNEPSTVASCKSVKSWPGSHIYKTIGSNHFSDVRRNTSGIIIKPGGSGPFPGCINIVDTKGNVVAKMGLYATGGGWAARYYAGIGCGSVTPFNGAALASRARQKTGSSGILANFGNVCYGPIDASRCIGSGQC